MSDPFAIHYKGQFECGDGTHISLLKLCDGIMDCATGTDETILCGRCINGKYHCAQNNIIRCSLACAVIGYVPCNGIQDRAACKNTYKSVQNTTSLSTSIGSAITSPTLHIVLALFIAIIVTIAVVVSKQRQKKIDRHNEQQQSPEQQQRGGEAGRQQQRHYNTNKNNRNIYVASDYNSSTNTQDPNYAQLVFIPPLDQYTKYTKIEEPAQEHQQQTPYYHHIYDQNNHEQTMQTYQHQCHEPHDKPNEKRTLAFLFRLLNHHHHHHHDHCHHQSSASNQHL